MSLIIELDRARAGKQTIAECLAARDDDLAGRALAAKLGDRALDLTAPLPDADRIEILTFEDEQGREVHRHSASHVMADAVKRLFPDAKLAIGPAIEEGFYYDFDLEHNFVPEDLERIEEEMRRVFAEDRAFERQEMPRAEAIEFFKQRGEGYKVELLNGLADDTVSIYRDGDFVDLCRGPHLPSTGCVGAFKLLNVAGAYWRGDERRPMLQRIYGTSFPTQEQLDEFVRLREQAAQRDHRRLGRELDLFSIPEELGGGLPLWHPKGALVRYLIEEFWRQEHLKRGYQFVFSPHIARAHLWETSGHLSFYREGMYGPLMIEDEEYRLKPMNCPFHVLIYKSQLRSYRDLPIRYCELGTVYRYERSGVLHGLLRVRGFTQDDAHIICTPEQIGDEVKDCLDFALFIMNSFGYRDFETDLSVRGEADHDKYMGSDEDWEIAERSLTEALDLRGVAYKRAPGEAVFYGPKIDIKLKDSMGRLWQGPTVQFDFNLTSRFNMEYIGADGQAHTPLMVHRALLGSIDRFFGGYVEHTGGAFPAWLAPVQVVVLPIAERHHEYGREVHDALAAAGFRSHLDDRNESMRYKIREAQMQKVPYMLVVGDREQESKEVSVRSRSAGDLGPQSLDDFTIRLRDEVETKAAG
ncbi:MAG: threonine--tRNA ligase [Armatimonadota bacterium]|nr:MAG: threonine--tRNA ligase [Armatimonadota bacterium]